MITVNEDGSVIIRLAVHVPPKGSHTAIASKINPCPKCGKGLPVVIEKDSWRSVTNQIRKQLKLEWGDRAPLAYPVRYSAIYTYRQPKSNRDPFPYNQGDLSKLLRRVEDWLAGSPKDRGPVLQDDNLIVSTGQHDKRWGESDGVVVKLTPIGVLG